jgi:hypothetical protein
VEELAPVFGGFPFVEDQNGHRTLRIPHWGGNEEIPMIAIADDYGDIVHGAFISPAKYNGQLVQGASQGITADQLVQSVARGMSRAI